MKRKYLTVGVIVLIIDQISKILIDTFVPDSGLTIIKGFFYFARVNNDGAAFSILEGKTFFLIIASIIILLLLFRISKEFKLNRWNILAFGLLFGGIIGNLSDRIFLGNVRDFLKFKIFGFNYPIFNLADVAIVVGAILLFISMIKGEGNEASSRDRKRKTR